MRVCVRVRENFSKCKLCQQVNEHRNHPPSGFRIPHPSGIGLQCKFRHKKIAPDGLERFGKDLGRIWETHSWGRLIFPISSAIFNAISLHWENMP